MENLKRLLQLAGLLTESATVGNPIQNPNSSGQGHDPGHASHPFHDTLRNHQYSYSHSTPINSRTNPSYIHHTYKHLDMKDHVVGIQPGGWQAGKLGSGRRTSGKTPQQLDRFLKGHVKRSAPKLHDESQ